MRTERNIFKIAAVAASLALGVSSVAVAKAHEDQEKMSAERWSELRENTVSAEELLGADVHNLGTPLGNVRDLILNEEGTAVEYVLYEVPFPYAYAGAQDGFVEFDNLAVEPLTGFASHVRIDDAAAAHAPDRLALDRGQADHRLVSNILGDTVAFEGEQRRPVEDILFDRHSGELTGYVVNSDPDAWFNTEPRVIPRDKVAIGERGDVTTSAEFAALESLR